MASVAKRCSASKSERTLRSARVASDSASRIKVPTGMLSSRAGFEITDRMAAEVASLAPASSAATLLR